MAKKVITYLHATQLVFSINAKPSLLKMKGHTKPVPGGRATNSPANNSLQPTHTDINLIASCKTRCSGCNISR